MNGWNETTGTTDHTQLMRYVRKLSHAALTYVRRDSHEAMLANPAGRKAGYYADLASYCGMRLNGTALPC